MSGPGQGEVIVYHMDVDDDFDIVISDEERARAARIKDTGEARRHVAGRSLARHVIASFLDVAPQEVSFVTGRHGKPAMAYGDIRFSMAHSCRIAAVAITCGMDTGLDVERIDTGFKPDEIIKSFFSPRESSYLDALPENERHKAFFQLWTRKEALLKATGEGIGGLCPEVDVLDMDIVRMKGIEWRLYDIFIAPGYAASLAVEGNDHQVTAVRYHFS